MSYLQRRLAERLNDPEFRQEWEDSELEYTIAQNIIKLRKEKNLTQADLARFLKTKQSVVSRIENANENLSLGRLKEIANVLDVKVIDILQETSHLETIR